jgi:hypothetical protein
MSKQGSLYIPEKSSKRWQKICDKQTDTEKKGRYVGAEYLT